MEVGGEVCVVIGVDIFEVEGGSMEVLVWLLIFGCKFVVFYLGLEWVEVIYFDWRWWWRWWCFRGGGVCDRVVVGWVEG